VSVAATTLTGTSGTNLWVPQPIRPGLKFAKLDHWNGTDWTYSGGTYDALIHGLSMGADGTVWSAGRSRGGSQLYVGRNGIRIMTPTTRGTLTAIATGFGLGFAVGANTILGGCDS
jgi:hypothetical protein